jgi:ATP-dependent DNA ligase
LLLFERAARPIREVAKAGAGIRFNEHLECDDGEIVFRHACKLGLEGIVSKRKDSTYRSGRSLDWLKTKNSNAPAVRRGRRRLEQGKMATTVAGKNRIMIYGSKGDGT